MEEKTLTWRSKKRACHQCRKPEGLIKVFLNYWNLILSKKAQIFQDKHNQGADVFRLLYV